MTWPIAQNFWLFFLALSPQPRAIEKNSVTGEEREKRNIAT
jgi:hypothetical protein